MADRRIDLYADPTAKVTRARCSLTRDRISRPAAQAKLLRAIQDLAVERVGGQGARRVDTRIIVASNRSLAALVGQDSFRLNLITGLTASTFSFLPFASAGKISSSSRGTFSSGT